MSNTALDFNKFDSHFDFVGNGLRTLTALLKSILSLPCFESSAADEFFDAILLLELCQDHAEKTLENFEECEGAYNGLKQRLLWKPEPGDQIPAELVSTVALHAIEPSSSVVWQRRAAEIGQRILKYSDIHPELKPLLTVWINFARKHGGDVRLHEYRDGCREVTWNGPLKGHERGNDERPANERPR